MRKRMHFSLAISSFLLFLFMHPAAAQNTSPYWSLAGNSNASTTSMLGTTNKIPLYLVTNRTPRLYISPSAGYVGIGTIAPTTRLQVNTASGTAPLKLQIGDTTRLYVSKGGGLTVGSGTSAPPLSLYVVGKVGIGTNAPASILDVAGGNNWNVSTSEGDVRIGNATYRLKIGVATGGLGAGDARIRAAGGTNRLILGANDALTIDGSGNTGIGTIAPLTRLDVRRSDGGFVVARFVNTATTADRSSLIDIINGNSTPTLWRYGAGGTGNGLGLANGEFYIERGGAGALFTIHPNGNVGIGASSLAYKLNVNGTIRAKEVRVESGWADYVFDKDYKLQPLDAVATYIQQHKHLPGIASATEIQQNGLAVGEMQTKMMEKIEELTLYIIDLQKQITQLQQEKQNNK